MTDGVDLAGRVLDELWSAVIVTDANGTITRWNTRAEELYGWSPDEAVGKSIFDIVVPATEAGEGEEIMAHLAEGKPWEGTFRVNRKDGTAFIAHVRDVPVTDEAGAVVGVVGLSYDLSRGLFAAGGDDPDEAAFQLERLQSLTATLAEAMTAEDAAAAVIDEGVGVLDADAAILCRVASDGRFEVVANRGYPAEVLELITASTVNDLDVPLAVAVRARAPVVVAERTEVERRHPVMAAERPASEVLVALPLIVGGGVIGAVGLGFDRPTEISDGDLRYLLALSNACAQALHRADLYARADENVEVLNAFMAAAPVGLGLVDDEQRFVLVNQYLARVIGRPVEAHLGRRVGELLPSTTPDVVPIIQSVLDTGVPVTGVEVKGPPGDDRTIVASWYPVPGPGGSRRVGLALTDVTARRVDEVRLREESQIVETLHFVGRRLAGELDPARVLEVVTDASTHVTGAEGGVFVELVDGLPRVGAQAGRVEPFVAHLEPTLLEPTLRQGETVRVADIGAHEAGAASFLGVPVISRSGDPLGGVFLLHPLPHMFDARDERLVVGIAGQAAVALDNARLYQAERTARERLALLADAGRHLAATLDVEEMVERFARVVVPTVSDVCVVDVVEDDGRICRTVTAAGGDQTVIEMMGSRAPTSDHPTAPAAVTLRTTAPMLVDIDEEFARAAWPDDPEYQRFIVERFHSGAAIPMLARSGIIGVLTLAVGGDRPAFGDDDVSLLEDLARRVGVAIENARLYHRERDVAVSLQQSLLPDVLPKVEGVELASRYLPGGPDVEVGGDWYDVLRMPNGTIGLAMGDVVGRGVKAAALMGQVRSTLRAYAFEGHTPAECLALVDRLLPVLTGGAGALVTAVKAHLDPATRRLQLSNAGHLPPLVITPDGDASFIEEALAVPLGTMEAAPFENAEVELEPGTLVVLYTDGLVEVRDESLDVGLARLLDAVRAGPHDLEALCDHLLAELLADRTRDDVALLVVRLTGS